MDINRLFDYEDFNNSEFLKVRDEIHESSTSRKVWEFVVMTYGLNKLGCFNEYKVALGLGCLKESLIYTYANRFKHTYATDTAYYLIGDKNVQPWGSEKYTIKEVYDSGIPYDRSKLTVLPMDMTKLEFPDEMFDVVWCSSSVEHVGTIADVLKCFEEVQRVLKPGGVFSITTEWNLSGTGMVRFANVQSFDQSVIDLIDIKTPKLKLAEPIVLNRSNNPKNKEKEYMLGKTHNYYGSVIDYTSMSLFWRKS